MEGKIDRVTSLIAQGADVTHKGGLGYSPLMWAARCGHIGVIAALIPHLNANALNTVSQYGHTALMLAIANGHAAAASILIEAGADVTLADREGKTALMFTTESRLPAIAFRLLSAKKFADVLALQTPYNDMTMYATECRQVVLNIQKEIFGFLRTLRLIPGLTNDPINLVVSNPDLYPAWYQHRVSGDINLMWARLNQIIANRPQRANAQVAQLQLPLVAAPLPLAPAAPTYSPTRGMMTRAQTKALRLASLAEIHKETKPAEQAASKKARRK
jgi:hypothetical protein